MFFAKIIIENIIFADIIISKGVNIMNVLRKWIESKKKICGTVMSLTDPCICEIIGNIGFDCVWIDMEHTYMSPKDVLCHLNAARSTGMPSMVRVPQDDFTVTKQILEMGPEGIIFPMVKTAEEAKRLMEMTLYPPLGNRGFGPVRAIKYGASDVREYVYNSSLEMCRFIQVEHIECIENLEEIVKIPHIDGFIFGPNDLSGSIGELLNIYDGPTVSLAKRAIYILKKHDKYIGLAGAMDETAIKFWSELGVDMIMSGVDWDFIYSAGKQTLKNLHNYHLNQN